MDENHFDKHLIHQHVTQQSTMHYWQNKYHYSSQPLSSIDWPALRKSIHIISPPQFRRMVKHSTGHFGCGTTLLRRRLQDHDHCPFCNASEDPQHILRCGHPLPTARWNHSLRQLRKHLQSTQTDPALTQQLIRALHAWKSHSPVPPSSTLTPITTQHALGWYPIFHSQISNSWRQHQQAYLTTLASTQSPLRWTAQLIAKLANISWDMWADRNGILHHPTVLTPAQQRIDDDLNQVPWLYQVEIFNN